MRRIELRATDPASAAEHYRQLFGWIVMTAEDGTLRCWVGDRLAVLVRPPTSWETTGWHAVFGGRPSALLTDPAGISATLDPGRVRHGPFAPPPRHGEPCWIELMTATATDDYWNRELGWATRAAGQARDIKPFALHTVASDEDTPGERAIAGRLLIDAATAAGVGTTWMTYFAVSDIEAATDAAVLAGGTVLIEPREVETGLLAAIADPFGTVSTLLQDPIGWGGAWAS
ncbi:hypothetical protein BC739_001908 [Kutzneria viridogrisea]|uniref:Glyoxalase/fosfomycin resistance/dioxygenase domain-containing protein n=1 Tax=Kutzneria viridogrisea TaxID=47990 RepID=A0ABR6BDB2_9PSEU|nr:VOC family protein [Kutzneria albida]MBA8924711.1 hypothetical protein [Kutzneria viridogrisea]